ncbi:ATP-binding protein [Arthrobacter terrae]|uniref:ATP-binding protein n=1 Tax=Arthrobacter terrae TaxID=2935737 RepID=UPI0035E3F959
MASANQREAALVPHAKAQELMLEYAGADEPSRRAAPPVGDALSEPDLVDVAEEARNALEVAAAERHYLLLAGPPGAGKTMLAERPPGLLPD